MQGTTEQAIREATAALVRAVNGSDVDAVMAVWDPSGTLMPPGHSSVHGQQAIRAYFERLFQRSRFTFEFAPSQLNLDGCTAIEYVQYSASAESLDGAETHTDRGKGVHVYRRASDGSWKLLLDIWSSDAG